MSVNSKVVIGIDQSYKCTGVAVYVYNGETKRGVFGERLQLHQINVQKHGSGRL